MKTRSISIFILLCVSLSVNLLGQKEAVRVDGVNKQISKESMYSRLQNNSDLIFKMKKEYFRINLQLTEEGADEFWKKFEEFLAKEKSIHTKHKNLLEKEGIRRENGQVDFDKLNDEQIFFYYESKRKMKKDMLNLDEEFYEEMKELLEPQSIVKFYQLEKKFKNEISDGMKKARENTSGQQEGVPEKQKR